MNWDKRLDPLGVKCKSATKAKWALVSGVYENEEEAQGNHIILFNVQDENGKPLANVPCIMDWVNRDPGDVPTRVPSDQSGQANTPLYAVLNITKLNGPYFAYIEDPALSDIVTGMGLPEHHHVNFVLTFQLQKEIKAMPEDNKSSATDKLAGQAVSLVGLINYQEGSVVSRTLVNKSAGTVTLFAFDAGQSLSEHTAPYDALVVVLEGEADITVSGNTVRAQMGDLVVMPANAPHALVAVTPYKMMLTMIRS